MKMTNVFSNDKNIGKNRSSPKLKIHSPLKMTNFQEDHHLFGRNHYHPNSPIILPAHLCDSSSICPSSLQM